MSVFVCYLITDSLAANGNAFAYDKNLVDMSHVIRKHVFGVSNHVQQKPSCVAIEDG